ncbi:CHAT domain-containing protein [Microseira wollei]|uniref:TPR repeat-containing protein n=1 Tax=Microseira wollei NIES-4236 TaxID=2530354 RepID=A0AAV3XAY1_9CYAN|nr:tetratricopeptide repeat protein [Microseira wollei]GET37875.1 TPR repeat-containing protein [Microseira wollei NIES-4236]
MLDKIIRDISITTSTNLVTAIGNFGKFVSTIVSDSETSSSSEEFSDPRQQEAKQLLEDGIVKLENNHFRAASQSLEAALEIYREIGDRAGETKSSMYIMLVSLYVEEPRKQLENIWSIICLFPDISSLLLKEGHHFFTELSRIMPQLEKSENEIFQLMQQGKEQLNLSKFIDALKIFEQGLNISLDINHPMWIAISFNNIGEIYRHQGQYLLAKYNFYQARESSEKISKDRLFFEVMIQNNIGAISYYLGEYSQAQKFLEEALAIHRQIDNKAGEALTFTNLGGLYDSQGDYFRALEFHQQALEIHRELGDRFGEATTLNNIGVVYNNLDDYERALANQQQALDIFQEIGNPVGKGRSLMNMGLVYQKQGKYSQAMAFLKKADTIFQEIGDRAAQGMNFNNLGALHSNLGQYNPAKDKFKQALCINEKIGDRAWIAISFNNIGHAYLIQGQYDQAQDNFQKALAIFQELGYRSGESGTLNNLGMVLLNQGEHTQALDKFQQALIIAQEIGNKSGEANHLANIGGVYYALGEYLQALQFYQQSADISKEIGARLEEGICLTNIGAAFFLAGNLPLAEQNLRKAVEILKPLRSKLSDMDKVSIFQTQLSFYRGLQQVLVAQGKTDEALEVAEAGRARAFVDLLAERLTSPSKTDIQPTITLAEIKQIAKEQNATLVEYSLMYDDFRFQSKQRQELELYIWVIKPTGDITFCHQNLPPQPDSLPESGYTFLQNLITNTRRFMGVEGRGSEMASSRDIPIKKLKKLHHLLIEPIADLLPNDPNERIIFMPQKELFLVPFAALLDKNGNYLIEKHTILTAPAIQVLQLTHQQQQRVSESANNILVVGNPSPMPEPLSALPHSEQEALNIAQMHNTQPLIGDCATKAAILPQLERARLIHLATHGIAKEDSPLESAIAFAPSVGDNGWLTAEEIFHLQLSAELVVLSACSTGKGKITGDGVVGLSRSLISAGVPSVIVSLWSVHDASTAFLMTEFYRNLHQLKLDKAQALRSAMLTTMQKYANPKNWAAFILIGESGLMHDNRINRVSCCNL